MANEKRLIDQGKVYQLACAGCIRHGETLGECYHDEPCERLIFAFTVAEPVDAVEVVQCQKCHFAKPYIRADGEPGYYCQNPKHTFQYGTNWERLFEPVKEADDFCSYGERREGE